MSLKVLSAHLGLSIAAISRVRSATRRRVPFPMETQDRILTAAEMLNYQPNLFARSLRNRPSQTIGVLVPEVSEGYTTLVLSGIEQQLQADYFYFLVSHPHREEMIQWLFQGRAVESIIAVDTLLRERLARDWSRTVAAQQIYAAIEVRRTAEFVIASLLLEVWALEGSENSQSPMATPGAENHARLRPRRGVSCHL